MKNPRIVKAYDSINPTAAAKERMLRAIQAEAEPIYRAKPVKSSRRGLIGAIAACFAVLVISGVILARLAGRAEEPVFTQPTETDPTAYETLLNTYRTAMEEEWTADQCLENGISSRFADAEYCKANAAYVLLDIDGNHVEELIIGHGMPHYFYVWDLYAFDNDGQPVQLHTDIMDHTNCHLYNNGIIGTEFTGKTEGAFSYFRLNGSTLTGLDVLTYRDDFWYDELSKQQLSQDEANEILGKYDMLDVEPTYLMDVPSERREDNEAVEQYMLILEKYKTALTENWTWEQCDQADISRQIMFDTTNKNDLGWCLMDLDENGVEELVISDGTYLFDLYTLNGQPEQVLSAYPNHYTLCKDGTVERRENHDAVNTYWRWFRLSGTDLVQQDVVFYEGEKHQYSYGTSDDTLNIISENDVGKYLVNPEKSAMDLTLTPFVEKQFPEVKEPNFYYESLIETYRQAIQEKWDPSKCVEKGISLMVGYYGGIVTQLGHNQIDLNGDGDDELIITDGTNIYDLYTIISDEEVGPLRLIDASERNQFYLTTDGQIYNMASGSAMLSYYYLFDVGQKELVFDKGLKFDASVDQNNPWSYYEESMDEAVACTAEDARVIMDAIYFADISFIPFSGDVPKRDTYTTQLPVDATKLSSYGYAEYIGWLHKWREAEFENPPTLYYCLTDINNDGITDLVLGYADSVQAVWSYMYDKNSKTEHLTLLTLSNAEYTELDNRWRSMDIRNITEFELE